MTNPKSAILLIITAITNLSACSYIQSLFPDKEKDYQFTTEIPPLILPNDLKTGAVAKAVEDTTATESETVRGQYPTSNESEGAERPSETIDVAEKTDAEETVGFSEQVSEESAQPEQSDQKIEAEGEKKRDKNEGTSVELVRFSNGERRLRIADSPALAWQLVSKALSRNSIEVTDRDQSQKLFYVRYNPEVRKVEDGSLWDEAVFLFKGTESGDKEYMLKLVPVGDKTDLAITDSELNPVTDDAAVKLLRLLGGTIQGN